MPNLFYEFLIENNCFDEWVNKFKDKESINMRKHSTQAYGLKKPDIP